MSHLPPCRRVLLPLLALPLLAWPSPGEEEKAYPTMGTIVRKDPRFDALVPPGAKLEKLAGGFKWTEGPVWTREGALLFAEIPANNIIIWAPGREAQVFIRHFRGGDERADEAREGGADARGGGGGERAQKPDQQPDDGGFRAIRKPDLHCSKAAQAASSSQASRALTTMQAARSEGGSFT